MTMKVHVLLVFFSLYRIGCGVSVKVHCPDLAESCECQKGATECEFTLRVEERFSFVSYAIDNDDKLTEKGNLHHIDGSGFQYQGDDGTCSFTNAFREKDFRQRRCSVPITLDGVTYRTVLTINGRTPGPTLVVHQNQTVVARVINKLPDAATSIHWHGMHQHKSVWMDGVGHITQPPIDPGSFFDYIFKAYPTGTHWYHSHVGSQKSDGLFGALIVCEEEPLSEILGDRTYQHVIDLFGMHTLAITDWQRKPEAIQQAISGIPFYPSVAIGRVPDSTSVRPIRYNSIDGASQGPFPFWSALINGRGRGPSTPTTPLSVFHVGQGNLYHFRLIGATSIFAFRFSIDGHKLKAIASDGSHFKPVDVDYIVIHSGETYDFILDTTLTQTRTNFWIHADTLEEGLSVEHSARAILTYEDPSGLDWRNGYSGIRNIPKTCSNVDHCEILNCPYSIHPMDSYRCISLTSLESKPVKLETDMLPKYPPDENCLDCQHFLNFAFVNKSNSVNCNKFKMPPLPYATNCNQYNKDRDDSMVKICDSCTTSSSSYSATDGVCECTNVIPIATREKYNPNSEPQSVTLILSAINSTFSHPIHLHGHSFYVVYMGNAKADLLCDDPDFCTNPRWRNGIPQGVLNRAPNGRITSSAIRKDTVVVQNGSYVVIAFQADNPGYWFMHCHVEEHLIDGMAVLVQEYTDNQHWTPPAGINNHGSFKWTAEQFNITIARGNVCSAGKPLLPVKSLVIYIAVFGIWKELSSLMPL